MPALSRQKVELAQHDLRSLWVKNFIPNHALAYRRTCWTAFRSTPIWRR
jgi:hypothetical protein